MTGIEDVAAAAGVSASTVSRALRGMPDVAPKTRLRIEALAADLAYVPSAHARAMASGRSMALNVVVPTITSWFIGRTIDGIDSVLRDADYDIVLYNLGKRGLHRQHVFQRSLLRKRGDAVLALCIDFSAQERQQINDLTLSTMVVGGPVEGIPYVGIDEVEVGLHATRHLLERGHRHILHLTGGGEQALELNPRVPGDRRRGYELALQAGGIRAGHTVEGNFSLHVARRAVGDILRSGSPIPSAIFAASDEMAIGAMLAAHDHGMSVPGDISIIGVDDHPLATEMGLTTIRQDPFAQGALATRSVIRCLERLDTLPAEPILLPTTLIDRGSTGPA